MNQFGGNKIASAEVLDVIAREGVTIVADLADGREIPSDSFDSIICAQVLMYIYDVRAAVDTIFRILAPGGVVLITLAGISQITPATMMAEGGVFWRFTRASAQRLFADAFGEENVIVESFGNVLVATAFLHGLVAAELTAEEMAFNDPDYPVTIAVRAVKAPHQAAANA
jgi:SAM-dependent methyltransferase